MTNAAFSRNASGRLHRLGGAITTLTAVAVLAAGVAVWAVAIAGYALVLVAAASAMMARDAIARAPMGRASRPRPLPAI